MESKKRTRPLELTLIFCTLLGLVASRTAGAGLLDSPPPVVQGKLLKVVYRMGPVYYEANHVDTIVTCTNQNLLPVVTAMEVFNELDQPSGQLAVAVLLTGQATSFVTSLAGGVSGATIVPGLPATPHGKARISATSAEVSCRAVHHIRAADGSTIEVPVTLLKKVGQGS
jgi:hypothetical protein